MDKPVAIEAACPCHPEGPNPMHGIFGPTTCHEPMQDELRCVYCGQQIAPVNCNGCGRFLSVAELQEGFRCEDCY